MSAPVFIAKKIRYSGNFSGVVIRIATASVALGVAVLIMAFCVLQGFRDSIHEKVFSFGGHIAVRQFSTQSFYEEAPISTSDSAYLQLKALPQVAHIQQFSFKPALVRSEKEVQGIMLKGIDKDFNFSYFKRNLTKGTFPELSEKNATEEVLISEKMAQMLGVDVGQNVILYFVQNPPRYRKARICGLFKTYLEEFDNSLVLAPLPMIRELNAWKNNESGGFELFINDFKHFDRLAEEIEATLPYNLGMDKITDTQQQIFEWLSMIGRNVDIMLVLICLVAAFNMVSTLLIMILERTNTVGILKAMGASNRQVQWTFWINGSIIALKGLFWGNMLGLGISYLQFQFHLIKLNPESYYMEYVPIAWNWNYFLIINAATIAGICLSLVLPTLIVQGIRPTKAIRFN